MYNIQRLLFVVNNFRISSNVFFSYAFSLISLSLSLVYVLT